MCIRDSLGPAARRSARPRGQEPPPACARTGGRGRRSLARALRFVRASLSRGGAHRGRRAPAPSGLRAARDRRVGERGQLADLMALGRGGLDALLLAKVTRARSAVLGPMIDDLVHLFERKQGAALARVAGLSAGPPARGCLLYTSDAADDLT